MTKRRFAWSFVGLALLFGATGGCAFYRPDQAVRVATGVIAHDVCSKTFVSGFDSGAVLAETLTRPGIGSLAFAMDADVDRARQSVTATFANLIGAQAVHRPGFGCVLLHDAASPYHPSKPLDKLRDAAAIAALPEIAGPTEVQPVNAALSAAIDRAFEEPPAPPLRRTKAVVVLRDGRVIGERYLAGVGPDTPLMGFSLTKSLTATLIGRLVQQGRISLATPAPIREWDAQGDQRRAITIEHLLRMTTGLNLDETNSGFDVSSRILYLENDLAAASARGQPVTKPGTRWSYSSPSTLLLSRTLRETIGGPPEATVAFAWRELFQPLGMRTPILELDGAGTVIGSTNAFASARDWARLGQLYLNDGMAGSIRLLPAGWAAMAAQPTLGTAYGAGFWTVAGIHPWSKAWAAQGMPEDAYFGSGDLGQRLAILPTQRLVIVRLGDAVDPTGDIRGFIRLVVDVIAAISP